MPYNTPEKKKAYMERSKARRAEVSRIWKEKNKEHCTEYKKQYRKDNLTHCKEYSKQYHQTPEGRKARIMSHWRQAGVKNVTDEMYNNYIATTHCECCLKAFSSSRDRCLDHDHETGEFRWVICHACNVHDNWKKKINTHQGEESLES